MGNTSPRDCSVKLRGARVNKIYSVWALLVPISFESGRNPGPIAEGLSRFGFGCGIHLAKNFSRYEVSFVSCWQFFRIYVWEVFLWFQRSLFIQLEKRNTHTHLRFQYRFQTSIAIVIFCFLLTFNPLIIFTQTVVFQWLVLFNTLMAGQLHKRHKNCKDLMFFIYNWQVIQKNERKGQTQQL